MWDTEAAAFCYFHFYHNHSWPVTKAQEPRIPVQQLLNSDNVIRIKKFYGKYNTGQWIEILAQSEDFWNK